MNLYDYDKKKLTIFTGIVLLIIIFLVILLSFIFKQNTEPNTDPSLNNDTEVTSSETPSISAIDEKFIDCSDLEDIFFMTFPKFESIPKFIDNDTDNLILIFSYAYENIANSSLEDFKNYCNDTDIDNKANQRLDKSTIYKAFHQILEDNYVTSNSYVIALKKLSELDLTDEQKTLVQSLLNKHIHLKNLITQQLNYYDENILNTSNPKPQSEFVSQFSDFNNIELTAKDIEKNLPDVSSDLKADFIKKIKVKH